MPEARSLSKARVTPFTRAVPRKHRLERFSLPRRPEESTMSNLPETFGTLERNSAERAMRALRGTTVAPVSAELAEVLRAMGLLAPHDVPHATVLSENPLARVYRVETAVGIVCVKQHFSYDTPSADARERTRIEHAWFHYASGTVPAAAPALRGVALSRAALATEYLDPAEFPAWQSRLAAGDVAPWIAAEAGHLLGRLHAASAGSAMLRKQFAGRAAPLAFAPRSRVPSAAAARLAELDHKLAATRLALVHGAVTPDNVLVGPRGPVLIDADRAHYGDPIFDAASCLAAIALRMAGHCQLRRELTAAFAAFGGSYFAHVTWERPEQAESRAAEFIPALLLAGFERDARASVAGIGRARDAACTLLLDPGARLAELESRWLDLLARS
jgi:Ser/Thr protein kinase RdoA (MazF antagonist)